MNGGNIRDNKNNILGAQSLHILIFCSQIVTE